MIKIAFDYQAFFIQEYGGISRYYCKLASALNVLEGVEARIFAFLHINAYLAELPAAVASGIDVRRWPRRKKLFRLINEVASWARMGLDRPSVVHETYYSHKSVAPKGVPLVVTVYDMIHEKCSDSYAWTDCTSRLKKKTVERADHVICISRSTKNDLIELFGVPECKISVVHLGFEEFSTFSEVGKRKAMSIGKPYFLYVGQRSGYKNFNALVEAFASSSRLVRNCSIVCFGGGKFSGEEKKFFAGLGLPESQVVQVGGGDDILASFYRNAFAFVYPSLYEGFGIPPLEAMSLDCPVICSRSSSVPEVAGEAAEYFSPESTDAIRGALETVADSPSRRNELIRLGSERYRQFAWPRCAKETLAVYESLC